MAISPKLMMLDEPTSGMGRNETLELIGILRRLSERHTLMLVEHDMDVVFQLAHRITVLVNGSVLASGTPEASPRRCFRAHSLSGAGRLTGTHVHLRKMGRQKHRAF